MRHFIGWWGHKFSLVILYRSGGKKKYRRTFCPERKKGPSTTINSTLVPQQGIGPSELKMYSGEADAKNFFYVLENFEIRGKPEEDMAVELVAYLTDETFQFYYENFMCDDGPQMMLNRSILSRRE